MSQDRTRTTARNRILGGLCGAIWFLTFYGWFAFWLYNQRRAAGFFEWLPYLVVVVGVAVLTGWILPLLGVMAARHWPAGKDEDVPDYAVAAGSRPIAVLVHGTFAAQPGDAGDAWWQFDGELSKHLGTSNQGLDVLPFHWSGANRESDRRAAARTLAALLMQLEKVGRPYHIVAHSHGGNVVWQTLLTSVSSGHSLEHLRTWATVGTPFTVFRDKPIRLYHIAALAALTFAVFRPGGLLEMWRTTNSLWSVFLSFEGGLGAPLLVNGLILSCVFFFIIVAIDAIRRGVAMLMARRHRETESKTYDTYGPRHLVVASSQDEAINGLLSVANLKPHDVQVVPRLPYLGWSPIGKLASPILFLIVSLWNLVFNNIVNEWVFRLLRDRIYGNDTVRQEVHRIGTTPVVGAKSSVEIESEDEDALAASAASHAVETLSIVRGTLGLFAAGSPLSIALRHFDGLSLSALIHNSYFAHKPLLIRILEHISHPGTSSRPPAALAAINVDSFGRHLMLPSRVAIGHAAITLGLIGAVAIGAQLVFASAIAPQAASSRLRTTVSEMHQIAGLAHGDEARTWYGALCATGRCDQAAAGLHFEYKSDDNLQTALDLIRWKAACDVRECSSRDWFLQLIESWVKDARHRLREEGGPYHAAQVWQVAARLAGVTQVPNPFEETGANPIVARGAWDRVQQSLKAVAAEELRRGGLAPHVRARLMYIEPLYSLSLSERDVRAWDAELSPEQRFDQKLDLAEATLCNLPVALPYQLEHAQLATESLAAVMWHSERWWGECDRHLALARKALDYAQADYSALPAAAKTIERLARFWQLLIQARFETVSVKNDPDPWVDASAARASSLEQEVVVTLRQALGSSRWRDVFPVLRRLGSSGYYAQFDDAVALAVEELRKRLLDESVFSAELLHLCASFQCGVLEETLFDRLRTYQDLPREIEYAAVKFSRQLGHAQIEAACWRSRETPVCQRLDALEKAWMAEETARDAGPEVLRILAESPAELDERRRSDRLSGVFAVETTLGVELGGLAQRIGTPATSQLYLQAARAQAAVGQFHQALRYTEAIAMYEDRLLAASELLLRYEQFRRVLGVRDVDALTDWGNRTWDDVRAEYIRRNPSH